MENIKQNTEVTNTKSEIVVTDIGTTKITVLVGKKDQYGKLDILVREFVSNGVMRGGVQILIKQYHLLSCG